MADLDRSTSNVQPPGQKIVTEKGHPRCQPLACVASCSVSWGSPRREKKRAKKKKAPSGKDLLGTRLDLWTSLGTEPITRRGNLGTR